MKRKCGCKKKNPVKITVFVLIMTMLMTGCSTKTPNEDTQKSEENNGETLTRENGFDTQISIDAELKRELEQGYDLEEPLVVTDPYGNSPLTAVILFSTEESLRVTLTVKGKEEKDDIIHTFDEASQHMIPVYGLYPEAENPVILETDKGDKKELTIQTEAIPVDPGEITVDIRDEDAYDYGQLTFLSGLSGNIYAIDSAGDVRWFRQGSGLPFKLLSNGHVMYGASQTIAPQYYKSGIVETDLLGKVYREYLIPGGFHHDFFEMANGNLLVASDTSDFSTVEDVILEIDRETGEVVYELDMKELLDTDDGGSFSRTDHDWFHNNGIWYDETTDTILLSARHVDAVIGIHKTEKKISWILGDPSGWEKVDKSLFFVPEGDDFEWQYAQHQVSMLPNGDILLFDNGAAGRTKEGKEEEKLTGEQVYSRAVVYRIDTQNMTVKQISQFGKEKGKDWYSEWVSGAICLNGEPGNLWITSGAHLRNPETGNTDYTNADMMNPDLEKSTMINQVLNGKEVCEIKITSSTIASLSYRSIRMSLYQNGAYHDYETEGVYLGGLGKTEEAQISLNYDQLKKTGMEEGWTLGYDRIRLALNGTYTLKEDQETAPDGYLILENEDGKKAYRMFQTVSGDKVSVNGWVSPEGLEGETFTISFVIGDTLYETGKYVTF